MGRIGDAVRTLLQPGWDERLRRDRAELRAMITEFADMQEKFSMLLAREAKRRTRSAAKLAEEPEPVAPSPEPDITPATDHKTEIWRRFRAQGGASNPQKGE